MKNIKDVQQMIAQAIATKNHVVPPVKIGEKNYEKFQGTLRIGEGDPEIIESYSIMLHISKYVPFFEAIGLKRTAEKAFSCQTKEHLRLFANMASSRAQRTLRDHHIDVLHHNPEIFRAGPCLHYNGSQFIFHASDKFNGWVSDAGWEYVQELKAYRTHDSLQAAAIYAFSTDQAKEKIDKDIDPVLLKYLLKNPVAGPWATIGTKKQTAIIYAGQKHESVMKEAGFLMNKPWGRYATFDAKIAHPFFHLVPDVKTRKIFGAMPENSEQSRKLIDLDDIKISDLLEILESDVNGKGGKKKGPNGIDPLVMDYDRRTRRWFTKNKRALQNGFEDIGNETYATSNPNFANTMRQRASLLAEVYLQISIAKQIEAETPNPNDIDIATPPDGYKYYSEQEEGIRFQASRSHSINADDMGTGKTIMAAGLTASLRPKRSLHIVIPPVLVSYERHMHAWIKDKPNINMVKKTEKIQDGITIAPSSQFYDNPNIMNEEWDLVITDEFHRFKNIRSNRAEALYKINTKKSADYSGTPIPNRPQDLYNTLSSKLPQIFNSREKFMRLYGVNALLIEDPIVARQRKILRNLLGTIMRKTLMIRRIKKLDVQKFRQTIALEVNHPDLEKLLVAESSLFAKFKNERRTTEKIKLLAEIGKLRVETAKFKVPQAVDYIINSAMSGNVPLVFANYREIIQRIHCALKSAGLNFLVITGDSGTPAQRQYEIDRFQKGHYDGVIASFKAGGTGLTITRANHVIPVEIDWDPYDMLQAEDRAYRTGQLRDVYVDYLVIKRSIDNYIATNNNLKIMNVDDILIPTFDDDLDAIAFQIDENLEMLEKEDIKEAA